MIPDFYVTPDHVLQYIYDPVCIDQNFLVEAYDVIMSLPPYGRTP